MTRIVIVALCAYGIGLALVFRALPALAHLIHHRAEAPAVPSLITLSTCTACPRPVPTGTARCGYCHPTPLGDSHV
ncbi:hypothetical protein [Streptomyces sp. NPDC001985]|uniref:hypothetical protein n=1 Tax=Streptomyces sp. NPDC001985 TaxID=3154406 RepID=UPI0033345438